MLPFLSASWFEALTVAADGEGIGPDATVVQQVVTGGPDGDIAFVLEIEGKRLRATPGRDSRAVVTLTEAWGTAVRIHDGDLTAHEAIRAGLVKVGGDVRRLIEMASALTSLGPAAGVLRETTAGG